MKVVFVVEEEEEKKVMMITNSAIVELWVEMDNENDYNQNEVLLVSETGF